MTPSQFTLDLLPAHVPSLENFVPGPNAAALAAVRDAMAGKGPQFLHFWGAIGSGRSHLLRAAVPVAADESGPLQAVDDVHLLDAPGQAKLFALQNRVRETPALRLLTASDQPPAQLALREDVRTRLAWGLVFALRPIAETDRATALTAFARARGAVIDEELVPYMLTRLPRDMPTLVAVLAALDAYALERRSALTVRLLREWLQREGSPLAPGPTPRRGEGLG